MWIGLDVYGSGPTRDPEQYLSHREVFLYLVSPDRERRYRVRHWESLEAFHVEHPVGQLTLVAPLTAPWITAAAGDSSAFGLASVAQWYGWSLDLYVRDTSTPLWTGPIIERRLFHNGTAGSARVELTAHTFLYHPCWRRGHGTATNADKTYTQEADNVILTAIRANIGAAVVTPTGYGAATRTDFGPEWVFTGAADNSPAQASSVSIAEQAGRNLWAFIEDTAKLGDCYLWLTESSAGVWVLHAGAPYQKSDLSAGTGGLVISPQYRTAEAFSSRQSMAEIVNQARYKGSGSGATQTSKWYANTTSRASYGVFEGEVTEPGAPSTTYTDSPGAAYVAAQGVAIDTVEVTVRENGALKFNETFYMRDLVPWHDPVFNASGTAIVRGWKLSQSGTGPFNLGLTLGSYRASVGKQTFLDIPVRGPLGHASKFRTANGT